MEYAIVTGITNALNEIVVLMIIGFKWLLGGLFVTCLLCMFLDGDKFKNNNNNFYSISNKKGIK